MSQVKLKTTVYDVDEQGNIKPREIEDSFVTNSNGVRTGQGTPQKQIEDRRQDLIRQSQTAYTEAVNKSNNIKVNNLQQKYDKQLSDATNQENAKNAAAKQIAALTGIKPQNNPQASNMLYAGGTPNFNEQTGTYNAVAGGISQPITFAKPGTANTSATLKEYSTQLSKLETPSQTFDKDYYLKKYPDVAKDKLYGSKPEEHYKTYGKNEGRFPNPEQEDLKSGVTANKITELNKKIEQEKAAILIQSKATPTLVAQTTPAAQQALAAQQPPVAQQNPAVQSLSAERNFGVSPLASKLNFEVSDSQILDDYNTAKVNSLKKIVDSGNTQTVGIQERLVAAQKLLDTLPANSAQKIASDVYVNDLKKDLVSVQSAVADATKQAQAFRPLTVGSTQAASQINSFREYLKLPEQNTAKQIQEIDPESYKTSVALGQKYGEMATGAFGPTQNAQTEAFRAQTEKGYKDYSASGIGATQDTQTEAYRAQLQKQIQDYSSSNVEPITDPKAEAFRAQLQKQIQDYSAAKIGATTDPRAEAFRAQLQKQIQDYSAAKIGPTTTAETEALRRQIEGETTAQLALGSRLGVEEQRQYQQAARGAQSARGNIFGIAPAVEEAVTTGMAGEQRKLARYGAASQFLSSGQTTGDALARDVQLRDALQQARSGVGSQFLASGQTTSDALGRDVQLQDALQQARSGVGSQFLASGQTTSDAAARNAQLMNSLRQQKLAAGGTLFSSGQTVGDALSRDVQLRNALQQSKLGAGGQFLSSGQTMSDAMRGDIAFRDALQQNRLGAAANFVGGGPSVYNLANQRTGQQQSAMQQYIQANQALPGQFGQQPSTASNFYQTTDPSIPVALTNAFNQLYSSQANYGSSVYGSQVGAISRQPNGFQNFATVAGGVADLGRSASGFFGSPSSGAFFR